MAYPEGDNSDIKEFETHFFKANKDRKLIKLKDMCQKVPKLPNGSTAPIVTGQIDEDCILLNSPLDFARDSDGEINID